ncbi:MAG TPA: hypothetical protein VN950_22805, partial [Terriglobales bacterium]|nr:hypothetical protein [Terriglobales bacterium]
PGSDLGNEVEMLRAQVTEMQEDLNMLKNILMRQYGAFKASFGDQVIMTTDSADKWTAIKARLAPRLREAVEMLQLQGSMKRTQIASALRMDYSNCTKNVIGVLKAQGWIIENNGSLSLKQL